MSQSDQSKNAISGRRYVSVSALAGIALAAIPAITAVLYLTAASALSEDNDFSKSQVQKAVRQRADVILFDMEATRTSLERALSQPLVVQNPPATLSSIPGGRSLQLVPLDSMGVASLDPNDYGLNSLVLLDRVREAFETGAVDFEIINAGTKPQLVVTGRFSMPSQQGVVIVTLHDEVLARWVEGSAIGQFQIWQTFDSAPSIQVAGPSANKLVSSTLVGTQTLGGSPFELRLNVDPSALTRTPELPVTFWFLILAGLAGAYWLIVTRRRDQLHSDVTRIMTGASTYEPLHLYHPELTALADSLRQQAPTRTAKKQSHKSRKQPEQTPVQAALLDVPELQTQTNDGSMIIDSWIHLKACKEDAEQQATLFKLAAGIGRVAARSGAHSVVVSFLGEEPVKRAKTHLVKALLSVGVDVIDIGPVPPPLAHMATHNGTSTGAALILESNEHGGLSIGALFNRQWAGDDFWQRVTALSNESAPGVANGRSIKLDLQKDFCDRLSADIAIAEPLRIAIACDNETTLTLAEQCLLKTSCNVDTYLQDPGFSLEDVRSAFAAGGAQLSVILDSHASRFIAFDEQTNRIRDDHIFMALSQDVLSGHPGGDVIAGYKTSRSLSPLVRSCGGAVTLVNSKPSVLQQEMLDAGALIGGDSDGHIYLKDRWFGSDDAIYATARLAEIISNQGPLKNLLESLPQTSLSVLSLEGRDQLHSALETLMSDEAAFAGARISRVDGTRIDFADSWVHIDNIDCRVTPTLRFEGDDDACRSRLESLVADLLSQKRPELTLLMPPPIPPIPPPMPSSSRNS